MRVDDELLELAERQHWLVSRADVANVMTSRQWCRRVDDGVWAPVAPGIWRHRATPLDWKLQARAGVRSLGAQSALHGRTAVAWWGLGDMAGSDVEFVVPRSRRSRPFPFVVHVTGLWEPRDLMIRDGVRVTSATRTVVDLAAGTTTARAIEDVIDAAVHRRLTTFSTLRTRVGALCGRGFPGSERLSALLLDSGGESYLERKFLTLVRRAGLPRPSCQVVHRADGVHIARVDFQFAGTNVIVEVTGRLGHVSDRDRQRDARRRNALQLSGHIVLEFTTADVLDAQGYVVTTLIAQLGEGVAG